MPQELKCTSCNVKITNIKGTTSFKCPGCSEQTIIRCFECRQRATRYKCPKCGFEGPN